MRPLLLYLLLFISNTTTTSLQQHSGKAASNFCIQTCRNFEDKLNHRIVCSKYRRKKLDSVEHYSTYCEKAFFDSYRQTCKELCLVEHDKFVKPAVAKCTGMGSEEKLKACEVGFFGGIEQTLELMGRSAIEVEEVVNELDLLEELEKEMETGKLKLELVHRAEGGVESVRVAEEQQPTVEEKKEKPRPSPSNDAAHQESIELAKKLLETTHTKKLNGNNKRNVKQYIELHFNEKEFTLELYYDETTADSVQHFCMNNVEEERKLGYQGDVPTCSREILMFFRMTYPQSL